MPISKAEKRKEKDIRDKVIRKQGKIVEVLPAALEYKVVIEEKVKDEIIKHQILCTMSGKMKKNFIKVEEGDVVDVKIPLYNIDSGVIYYVHRTRGNIKPHK